MDGTEPARRSLAAFTSVMELRRVMLDRLPAAVRAAIQAVVDHEAAIHDAQPRDGWQDSDGR